ncbi:hypothetical protein [Dyella sp. 2RAB6]|uniref:hypothetical protein n=1 Tax=Dyella sp. 2RAB6 TaxID=3232992 RepID=UPI003F916E9E
MSPLPGQRFAKGLLFAGWTVLLALLPWWLGLALLLALTLGAVLYTRRAHRFGEICRNGLKWGLPGMLFALQRALGGAVIGWGAALLGALLGFSLIALLESLLLHRVRRSAAPSPEWSELAMAPVGPSARIIELTPVQWCDAADAGGVHYEATGKDEGNYRFADGHTLRRLGPRCAFSPLGHWFAANQAGGQGDLLFDRVRGKPHRLRGWELCGWDEDDGPWLARHADGVPVPLHQALGQDAPRD